MGIFIYNNSSPWTELSICSGPWNSRLQLRGLEGPSKPVTVVFITVASQDLRPAGRISSVAINKEQLICVCDSPTKVLASIH